MGTFTVVLGLLVFTCLSIAQDLPNHWGDSDSDEYGQAKGVVGTNCTCGWTNKEKARIVNGKEAHRHEFPFMVGIFSKYVGHFCGGSILSKRHVLTAAHCTIDDTPQSLYIHVGDHDISTGRETSATKKHLIDYKVEHPLYNPTTYVNDIAILGTVDDIVFNQFVGPVCLPTNTIALEGQSVRVAGWGDLSFNGKSSDILMKVALKVCKLTDCVKKYPSKPIKVYNPTQFCSYTITKDSCQGDSGGPVIWLDPDTNRYTQVGVVSFGRGCATPGYPGVNTLVSAYLHWIQSTIKVWSKTPVQTCSRQ